METSENTQNPTESGTKTNSSLLDQIIKTANDIDVSKNDTSMSKGENPVQGNNNAGNSTGGSNNPTPIIKKTRDPMTVITTLKIIGSLLIVAIIFFGSFLAYIAFNPDQAAFFVNIFGIDPKDIQTLLKNLINVSFGVIVLIFSIAWFISLFRAIWIPRDQKRRRLLGWMSAGIIGIFLFSILAFWAYLFSIINATDYTNPGSEVSIYDNDLYAHKESKQLARLSNTDSLIGPISLRFDLSANAKAIAKKNLLTIESYEINFDGAKCDNDSSVVKGSDPSTEQGPICTFDKVNVYNIRGTYSGRDRLGEIHTIAIPLNSVKIDGLIEISIDTNKTGKKATTINASKVKKLGNPTWTYETGEKKVQSSITEAITSNPTIVCLAVKSTDYDRCFIIIDTDASDVEGSILFDQDSTNNLGVIMTLTGINIKDDEIIGIDWVYNNGNRMCQGLEEKCRYSFNEYGIKTIVATIQLANKQSYKIQGTMTLNAPLIIARHAEVLDKDGNILNPRETFDPVLSAYVIQDIALPSTITLDAQNVVTENLGYTIHDIVWKISNGKTTTELIGEKVNYTIPKTERYTIEATYTFHKNIITSDADIRTAKDVIIVDLERKSLEPVLKIQQSSDYIPTQITADASASRNKNGEIKKFIFDFGEGKPLTEGDAIQIYEYKSSGEKKVTLTIIGDNNERASTTSTVILKDTPKPIKFTTTMSPGIVNMPVDFIEESGNSQIEEWIWNFGDNTPPTRGNEATHIFAKTGTYTVSLMVRYTNGTLETIKQTFRVDAALE